MNFVSKFDGSLLFTGTHPKAQTHVETVHGKAPSDAIVVKDANLLFNGDFKRSGTDLVISKDDQDLVLADYFKGDKRAPLASPDGAWLTGKIIETLTGHVQMAQADGSASIAPKIIGHVTKLTGNATVIRNGVSIILNNGDNVHQGDVVQSGSNSTVGITFIDGSVFGLASNAKMVLNEMIYDPNGSSNSSLLSLVSGTISFVAGATAKHGDMKVDTPVATMGIRGTAVLVEIDFEVTVPGSAPPARFQVIVEPDGTVGSLVLLDRVTLAPIATVNQAGTVTTVSGQGTVSFLASAQLSPEVMKLITEVFSQKFTDNSNPKSDTHFTDTVIPEISFPVKFAGGETGTATLRVIGASEGAQGSNTPPPKSNDHIPGAPGIFIANKLLAERPALTASDLPDSVQGQVGYTDINPGDSPTVSTTFDHYAYKNAAGQDVTTGLTATQRSAIEAVSVPLHVAQDSQLKNNGTATWTYSVPDHALDFLADGEKLTLTYMARVDNNFAANNEFSLAPFTITITGTNDKPTIESAPQIASIQEKPGTVDSAVPDTANGSIQFRDVDLTDTHILKVTGVTASGTMTGLPPISGSATPPPSDPFSWLSLGTFADSTDGVTGSRIWMFSAQDHYFDYLADGETVTLTYTVEVDDYHGGTVSQDVAVTVTGSNDAPELAADVSGEDDAGLHSILEKPNTTNAPETPANKDTAGGSLTFRDVDLSDDHSVSASGPTFVWLDANGEPVNLALSGTLATAGSLSLALHDSTGTGHGSVDFSYSISDHYLDFLAEDETLTVTYQVTVTDEHNVSSTRPVTITVTGTNDVPVAFADVVATGTIVEAGVDANNAPIASNADTSGNVLSNDTDVDLTDTHTVVSVVAGTSSADGSGNVGHTVVGTYGDLVLNANGTWTYHLRDDYAATNALPQGAHVADVFTYTQSDGHGGIATTTLTVNITGTNDTPVANAEPVAVDDHGAPVSEAGVNPGNDAFPGVSLVSGNVLTNDTDVDTGDTKTVQGVAFGDATGGPPLTGLVTPQVVHGTYGDLTINADGSWSYALDNTKAATQALTQGQHETEIFTYTMHDAVGSPSSAKLTIDVYGTNDKPTVAAPLTYGTDEGNASFTRDLLYGANDVDTGETATLQVVDVTYKVDGGPPSATPPAGISVTGSTLSVNPTNSAYDHLAVGAHTTITVSYNVKDAHGATVAQTETITINGTNDVPTVAAALTAAADEGDASFALDLVEGASDLDDGEAATLYVDDVTYEVDGVPSGLPAGVTRVGNTLTIDPTNAAFDHLAVGEHTTITVSYNVTDAQGATVAQTETITITGTNDKPTVTSVLSDSVYEGSSSFTHDLLDGAGDVDHGELATLTVSDVTYSVDGIASGLPAGVSMAGHTLTVDPTNTAFDHLAAGQHTTITVSYNVKDAQGATVAQTETITINGVNDAPAFDGHDLPGTYYAGGDAVAIVDTVSASDIDSANYAGGTLTAKVTDGGHEGDTLSIVNNDHITLVTLGGTTTVMYDADGVGSGLAVDIGTLGDGINTLTVTFNGNADDTAVAKLTQAIGFSNSKPDPFVGERTVTFTLQDGGGIANGGHDSDFFTAKVNVDDSSTGPVILTDNLSIYENSYGVTTVLGLDVSDNDPTASTDTFTMHAETFHKPETTVDPHDDTGLLTDIKDTLSDGITYDPNDDQSPTDMVTLTVADGHGHSDLVNFIFQQAGTGSPVVLEGTPDKDVIFATGEDDILTGGAKSDQFVFQQEDGPSQDTGQDTITDFLPGVDKIDFMFDTPPFAQGDETSFQQWAEDHLSETPGGDALINLDNGGTIQLTGVNKADLRVTDFYTHSGFFGA